MKAYLVITGLASGLLTLAHLARIAEEGGHLLKDPWWILATVIPAALSLWAGRLLWLARGRSADRNGGQA